MPGQIQPITGGDTITTINRMSILVPEAIELFERRYSILRTIAFRQPVGRRMLSTELQLPERTIRNELDILKGKGLLNSDNLGMYVTDYGTKILNEFRGIYEEIKGIPFLTDRVRKALKVKEVIVVPGNSQVEELVLKDMGKIAAKRLVKNLLPRDIVGVTGGTTMSTVAQEIPSDRKFPDVTIVPARGGLGTDIYTQSNSIAAKIAGELKSMYRLLYIPDSMGDRAMELALNNAEIKEVLTLITNMRILLFGIGRADTMARRRQLDEGKFLELMEKKAVSEAFGHYFDISGKEIWEYKTAGLSLDDYRRVEDVIGVAGGEDKAEAIISVSSIRKEISLVIDEAVANKILQLLNIKEELI